MIWKLEETPPKLDGLAYLSHFITKQIWKNVIWSEQSEREVEENIKFPCRNYGEARSTWAQE